MASSGLRMRAAMNFLPALKKGNMWFVKSFNNCNGLSKALRCEASIVSQATRARRVCEARKRASLRSLALHFDIGSRYFFRTPSEFARKKNAAVLQSRDFCKRTKQRTNERANNLIVVVKTALTLRIQKKKKPLPLGGISHYHYSQESIDWNSALMSQVNFWIWRMFDDGMDIISIPASLFYRDTEIKIVRRGHNILTPKVSQQVR